MNALLKDKSIGRFETLWIKIERGTDISNKDIDEINALRSSIPTVQLGRFYFKHGCYDSAYELLKPLGFTEDHELISVCESRLRINIKEREGLPSLDLDKIRPGLKEQLSLGEKSPLGEARNGWLKKEEWSIYSLSGNKIIDKLKAVSPFHNGMAKVKLNNGETVVINRHGKILKITKNGN